MMALSTKQASSSFRLSSQTCKLGPAAVAIHATQQRASLHSTAALGRLHSAAPLSPSSSCGAKTLGSCINSVQIASTTLRSCGTEQRRRRVCSASSFDGYPGTSVASALDRAQKELKVLEEERDAAVTAAENFARAAMKLSDMVELMEKIALEKVRAGDEEGAKQVLQEKGSTKEVLEKTSGKAQVNYTLAAKLAQKIGDKQKDILGLLQGPSAAPAAAAAAGTPPGAGHAGGAWAGQATFQQQGQQQEPSSSWGAAADRQPVQARWEQSLAEAKQRMSAAEQQGERAGRMARLSAEDSIAAARERLKNQATEDILSARARLKRGADESIKQAQERLRQQDAEVLAYVHRIMARYRRGDFVSEDELEFAFKQLEKRFMA